MRYKPNQPPGFFPSRAWPSLGDFSSIFFLTLLFLAATTAFAADVKVFVTNDVHSYVSGSESGKRISCALLQGRIEEARRDGFDTFLLDAGDYFPLSALYKSLSDIQPEINPQTVTAEILGKMGYNVFAPGNHDLDKGWPYFNSLIETAARFNPSIIVSSLNLTAPQPSPRFTNNPVVLVEEKYFRLVVLGIIAPELITPIIGGGGGVNANYNTIKQNLIDRVTEAVAEFTRPGDVVILLSHIGTEGGIIHYAPDQMQGTDLAAIPNVDFIVDSHSHNLVEPMRIGKVWYSNGGSLLRHFTEITLTPGSRAIKIFNYDQVKSITKPSRFILEQLQEYTAGTSRVNVDWLADKGKAEKSIPLGRLIGKAMQTMTGADLAICYRNLIQSGIPKGWKPSILLDRQEGFVGGGAVITFSMTGRDIVDFFQKTLLRRKRYFPQFYGMTVHVADRGIESPLEVIGIRDGNGDILDPSKDYTVAISNTMTEYQNYQFNLRNQRRYDRLSVLFQQYLENTEDPCPDSLRTNNTLIIHPTSEKAKTAFANPGNS